MPSHRKERSPRLRPRVRRIAAASVSTVITVVALLGASGVIPLGGAGSAVGGSPQSENAAADQVRGLGAPQDPGAGEARSGEPSRGSSPSAQQQEAGAPAVPASSGSGRRVVFSQEAQRVWLVDSRNEPVATYLVSGSVTENLDPGSYRVFSRSRWAVGVDDSGVMQYFVRFARGERAAIGFHSIPSKNGKPLQRISQLGTPQSHGCIRQKLSDAERMWGFATTGTAVVVVA